MVPVYTEPICSTASQTDIIGDRLIDTRRFLSYTSSINGYCNSLRRVVALDNFLWHAKKSDRQTFNWFPAFLGPLSQSFGANTTVSLPLSLLPESITARSGTSSTVSLGKRKKSIEEVNNGSNNSSGAAAAAATTRSSGGAQDHDDGLNVEDSGDEGSSRGETQRKKKARTTFTGRQIFELEKQFELKKYLSSSERADMAKLLNVTETQVGAPHFHSLGLKWWMLTTRRLFLGEREMDGS